MSDRDVVLEKHIKAVSKKNHFNIWAILKDPDSSIVLGFGNTEEEAWSSAKGDQMTEIREGKMAKTYVTFGQIHAHRVNGVTLGCDSVAVISCTDERDGRRKAEEYFGRKFCFSYYEDQFDKDSLRYFPRGLIEIPS